jgi:hypothetical protein
MASPSQRTVLPYFLDRTGNPLRCRRPQPCHPQMRIFQNKATPPNSTKVRTNAVDPQTGMLLPWEGEDHRPWGDEDEYDDA